MKRFTGCLVFCFSLCFASSTAFAQNEQKKEAATPSLKFILDFLENTITAPSVSFEYTPTEKILTYLSRKNMGLPIDISGIDSVSQSVSKEVFREGKSHYKRGDLFLTDHMGLFRSTNPDSFLIPKNENLFQKTPNVLTGPTYSIAFSDSSRSRLRKLTLSVLMGLQSQQASYHNTIHTGWGGAYGFTADTHTVIDYRTNYLFHFQATWKCFGAIPFASVDFRHTKYNVKITGKRWFYRTEGDTASAVRIHPPSDTLNITYSGTMGSIEPGLGVSLFADDDDRTQMIFGAKWNRLGWWPIFYVGATLELRKPTKSEPQKKTPTENQDKKPTKKKQCCKPTKKKQCCKPAKGKQDCKPRD